MTLSKEALIARCEAAIKQLDPCHGTAERQSLECFRIALESLLERRERDKQEPVRYMNRFTGACYTLEQQPDAATDAAIYVPLYAAPQSFGNSEQLEPASQPCKLRDGLAAIRKLGPIDAEKIQVERDVLNEPTCWCLTCRPVTMTDMRFVVCPECGNKRCPKANDHRNPCSGSNEPGQDGSAYPAAPKQESE